MITIIIRWDECILHIFSLLFPSVGYTEAQDLDVLKREGITHIINCSPRTCLNLYEDTFNYKNIDISDEPSFDILLIFFLVVDYIDKIISMGGKVLIHCFQVSFSLLLVLTNFLILRASHEHRPSLSLTSYGAIA
jgi:hypothetical protein